jgi:hypothetical protein
MSYNHEPFTAQIAHLLTQTRVIQVQNRVFHVGQLVRKL